ncbi:hypothetical protein AAMO2058_001664200 [Amorphochlora amoebiformis]
MSHRKELRHPMVILELEVRQRSRGHWEPWSGGTPQTVRENLTEYVVGNIFHVFFKDCRAAVKNMRFHLKNLPNFPRSPAATYTLQDLRAQIPPKSPVGLSMDV